MDKAAIKKLRVRAREIVADYEPSCGEAAFEDAVLRLAAIGRRLADSE